MSIHPNRDDSSYSSSNHSIISIQSIRSVTPISRPTQTSIDNTNSQQQIYTTHTHTPNPHLQIGVQPLQTPSIFNYHQPLSHNTNINHNNTHFIMNFNANNNNTHINTNNNNIPQIPTIPTLPPIHHLPLPLPLPNLSNSTHTHTPTNNIQNNNNNNNNNSQPQSASSSPVKLRSPPRSHTKTSHSSLHLQHLHSNNIIHENINNTTRKRKRKHKRKKHKNIKNSEDMYFYQLERACGLEIEEPAYIHGLETDENNKYEGPSPRFAHCSCIHGDYFYVWGGRNQTRHFCPVDNELYTYHLVTKKWKKIKPKLNPLYNSRETYNGSNPQPRYKPFAVTGATAIVYKSCIYIFGGYHSRYTNQLLKYDINNNYWSVVDARGDIPQRRWEYSACVYKKKMYIFGGTLDRTHFNDLYSFDFETSQWTEIQPVNSSNSPRPRRRHKACVYKHKMYIFGGREEPPIIRDQLPQDLQIYDFRERTWSRISCADSSSSISIPIALNHSLYVHKSQGLLYVFGCQDAPVATYDFKLNRWYPVSSRNYERHGLSLCTTHHGNVGYWKHSLYIFGGQSRDKVVQGNLLKFSLNPQPQYTRDMLSMLNNSNLSDIQFRMVSDDNMIVYAHKFMLMARCEYFKKMFSGNFLESKQEGPIVINIDNCSKKVFLAVLRYFYTDELWQPTNVNDTLEMLSLADLYQFKIMRSHCCKILENSIKISNAILLLQAARKFNLINLKMICKDFIMANFYVYQNNLGLMTDLIELIQLHSIKNNNDKGEKDDDDENSTEIKDVNEWKALHNEIMDAMGKLFVNNDNRILTERQKRLKVNLTQKDINEYKKTHKEMVYTAKYGKPKKIIDNSNKNNNNSLDDSDDEKNNETNSDNSDDDSDYDSEYSDDEIENENSNNSNNNVTLRPPAKRRRLNNNSNNNNATNFNINNGNEDNNPPVNNNNNNNTNTNTNTNTNNIILNEDTQTPNFVDESMDGEHLPYLVADVHGNHN